MLEKTERSRSRWLFWLIFVLMAMPLVYPAFVAQDLSDIMLNDDIMRLVEVRDLLNGQGWADMMQYRLGPDGGTLMHWSRLVDAPIALLIKGASLFLPRADAEIVAVVLWPLALAGGALALFMKAAQEMAGFFAGVFAALIGAGVLLASSKFDAGSLDHHNVQIVLMMVALVALLREKPTLPSGLVAGGAFAMSLAIGLETIIFIVIMAGYVALKWSMVGARARDEALGVSAGVTLGLLGFFVVLQPDMTQTIFKCDAFGPDLASIGAFGGAGFFGLVLLGSGLSRLWRMLAIAMLGALLIGFASVYAPACLAHPYAGLYPEVAVEWLARVGEVKGLFAYINSQNGALAGGAFVPVLALLMALKLAFEPKYRARALLLVALLATSYVMAIYQVRGVFFLLAISAVPSAAFLGDMFEKYRRSKNSVLGVLVFVVLLATIPAIPTKIYQKYMAVPRESYARRYAQEEAMPVKACYEAKNLALLAEQPQGLVAGHSNMGAYILAETAQRVLSSNFHRNQDGLRAEIELARVPLPEAERLLRQWGVNYVIYCDNFNGSLTLSHDNENGLWPMLFRGEPVDFLEEIKRDPENVVHVLGLKPEAGG